MPSEQCSLLVHRLVIASIRVELGTGHESDVSCPPIAKLDLELLCGVSLNSHDQEVALTAIWIPSSFKSLAFSAVSFSPFRHTTWGLWRLGTPLTRTVARPSERSWGSMLWGNGSES